MRLPVPFRVRTRKFSAPDQSQFFYSKSKSKWTNYVKLSVNQFLHFRSDRTWIAATLYTEYRTRVLGRAQLVYIWLQAARYSFERAS